MGERKDALEQVRECVKLDDNHKDCYDFYKLLKKFNALMDKADEAVQQHRFADVLDGLEKIHKLGVEQTVYFKQLAALKCKSLTELQRTADALTVGWLGIDVSCTQTLLQSLPCSILFTGLQQSH